jgi:HSP20 family protein
MRLRYQSVMYHSGSAVPSLEHHYRELRSAMFHFGQQATYPQPGAFWRPAMDIHETSDAVLVKIELAGMDDESIEITIYPNAIVVAGQRRDDGDFDEETYYHEAQIRYGPFRADAYLSTPIQAEMASAVYQNGFLRITLPRRARSDSDSPDASGQDTEGGVDQPESGEHALPGLTAVSEAAPSDPCAGRLIYSFPKETSHA